MILVFIPDPDPDPDFCPSRIPDPGVKKAPDPGSATLINLHHKTAARLLNQFKVFLLAQVILANSKNYSFFKNVSPHFGNFRADILKI
jgi:hypothetical protein